jgi:hypothetical protein
MSYSLIGVRRPITLGTENPLLTSQMPDTDSSHLR